MSQSRGRRRLAAVWFADIVGYTALSSRDEGAALRVVELLQDSARAAVEFQGGRVVKHMGDAVMAVFDSVDGALNAALTLQRAFHEDPATRAARVSLRVGLHMGEVLETEDGDLYGDGVNTASRVEGVADAGEVAVTGEVYRQIRNRSEYRTTSLGQRPLKGLAEPLEIWVVSRKGRRVTPHPSLARGPERRLRGVDRRAVGLGLGAAAVGFVALSVFIASQVPEGPGAAAAPAAGDEPPSAEPAVVDTSGEGDAPVTDVASGTTASGTTTTGRHPATPGPGSGWSASREADPSGRGEVVTATLRRPDGGGVWIRCRAEGRRLEVAVFAPPDAPPGALRAWAARQEGRRWQLRDDGRQAVFLGNPRPLLRTLLAGGTLDGEGGAPGDALDARRALEPLRGACGA